MKITTRLDFPKIPIHTAFNLRLLLALEGEERRNETARLPLNLALVLDRSGSMGGRKLDNVKRAAELLVNQLDDSDFFSLTVFDQNVDVLVVPCPAGSGRSHILTRIQGIRAGGSTFLSGGYLQGFEFARTQASPGRASRILILTDGLANVGITDLGSLCSLSASALEHGITTSTIGVGADFHEELLGKMAEQGGGSTYFIENPNEAEEVFAEELRDLFSRVAEDCQATFIPSQAVLEMTLLNTYRQLENGRHLLGDLFAGRRKALVVEVSVLPQTATGIVELGQFQLSYRSQGSEGGVDNHTTLPVKVQVVSQQDFAKVLPDPEVTVEAALLAAARARLQAIELADLHRFQEAAAVLENCARQLAALGVDNLQLNREIHELRYLSQNLRQKGMEFYSPAERKRAYISSDLYSKGRSDKVESMLRRQGRFRGFPGPDET